MRWGYDTILETRSEVKAPRSELLCFPFFAPRASRQATSDPRQQRLHHTTLALSTPAPPVTSNGWKERVRKPTTVLACVICPRGTRLGQARTKDRRQFCEEPGAPRASASAFLLSVPTAGRDSPKPPHPPVCIGQFILACARLLGNHFVKQANEVQFTKFCLAFAQNQTCSLLSPPQNTTHRMGIGPFATLLVSTFSK